MKLLITSPDALIDNVSKDFFPGIINSLDAFIALTKGNVVIVVSIHGEALKNIPARFHPIHIQAKYRGSPFLIETLKKATECEPQDVIILGSKRYDMYTASNTKSLLLRADYALENNPTDILYTNKYGIPIRNAAALTHFFGHFTKLSNPWYYSLQVDDITAVYALTKANTMGGVTATHAQLNDSFRNCLKDGVGTYRTQFMIYFLVSTYLLMKVLQDVDYWGIYPSSKTSDNPDLEYFKDKARQAFNCKINQPLFLRTKATTKRSNMNRSSRISNACDSQLDSLLINPYFQKGSKLKGKTVCVIDDFTTYGSSAETVRALLEKAGVAKIIFIALGKFGKEYHKFDYTIGGDVFEEFTYERAEDSEELTGDFNNAANFEFITSLGDML